jgi:hypothetical protein
VRLRTGSEGRPYKCEEEGTHTHKTACGARSESCSFVVGVLGDPRGCDPWAGSGKGSAVHAGDTNQNDGAKAGRGHLQLGMDFGVTVAGEKNRTVGCGDHIGAATLAETAANINAQAAVIGESRAARVSPPMVLRHLARRRK